jgi:hypothetical protein
MAKAGTSNAVVRAEDDIVGRCPGSFERRPRRGEGSAEKATGRPGDLGTPAALWCEGTDGRQSEMGEEVSARAGKGERGIGFFLQS